MDKVLLIARYVEGDLNAQEYREFETVVAQDSELQEYLYYYNDMHLNLGGQLKDALGLSKYSKEAVVGAKSYVAEKIDYTVDHLWYLTVALVIAVGLFIWKPWTPDLYNEFKVTEQQFAAELNNTNYKDFTLAANFVEKKQFYEAKLVVSKLYMKSPEDMKLSYYYGVMLLQNGSYETIGKVLSPIFASNSSYKDAAAYVMALSSLKQKNNAGVELWLGKINRKSSYYAQATALKAKLLSQSV